MAITDRNTDNVWFAGDSGGASLSTGFDEAAKRFAEKNKERNRAIEERVLDQIKNWTEQIEYLERELLKSRAVLDTLKKVQGGS